MIAAVLLICAGHYGSATILDDGRYVTAAHVAEHGDCNLGPIHYIDQDRDLAIGTTSQPGTVRVSCDGIVPRQEYRLMGYTRNGRISRSHSTRGSTRTQYWRGSVFSMLAIGSTTEGMSGGPVFNPSGELVAIINARNDHYHQTLVQPLKETPLCRS